MLLIMYLWTLGVWGEKRETERQKQRYTSMWTSAKRLHGPVVGIPEVEEKAHLCTVWHHPPSGCVCVLCGGEKVCGFYKWLFVGLTPQRG